MNLKTRQMAGFFIPKTRTLKIFEQNGDYIEYRSIRV